MVFEKIQEVLASQFEVDAEKITRETDIMGDLGADSLDIVELTMALEEEFELAELPEEELKNILTVGDLADYVSRFVSD